MFTIQYSKTCIYDGILDPKAFWPLCIGPPLNCTHNLNCLNTSKVLVYWSCPFELIAKAEISASQINLWHALNLFFLEKLNSWFYSQAQTWLQSRLCYFYRFILECSTRIDSQIITPCKKFITHSCKHSWWIQKVFLCYYGAWIHCMILGCFRCYYVNNDT